MAFLATTYTNNGTTITDAEFRTFVQNIHNTIDASPQNQATGVGTQIDPLTTTFPVANNTYAGYEIWEFADTQQASNPLKYKLEYGREAGANQLAIRITIASGFDSSGNPTGTTYVNAVVNKMNGSGTAVTNAPMVVSAGDRYTYIQLVMVNGSNPILAFERSVDATGVSTSRGFGILTNAAGTFFSSFIPLTGTVPAAQSSNTSGTYGSSLPPAGQSTGLQSDGNVNLFPHYYFGLGGETFVSSMIGMVFSTNVTLNAVNTNIVMLSQSGKSIYPRAANETGGINWTRGTLPATSVMAYYVRAD